MNNTTTDRPLFTIQKILKIFGAEIHRNALVKAELSGNIPPPQRLGNGVVPRRVWPLEDLPAIGAKYGFLKKLDKPTAITVFTTKGGVLKTTLALNIARMAALHGIKTCVVGLDMQCDITHALGFDEGVEDADDLETALKLMKQTPSLRDLLEDKVSLDDLIVTSDIPTLSLIPENPDLVGLDQALFTRHRREYWLKDNVVDVLLKKFDLVVMDCSPNWNRLITSALVASDALISPLECKINNFNNFKVFRAHIDGFRKELKLGFQEIFVPTRFTSTRKLSTEIKTWYMQNVPGCIHSAIKESVAGEEATASHLSVPEHCPTTLAADEMRDVLMQIWARLGDQKKATRPHAVNSKEESPLPVASL